MRSFPRPVGESASCTGPTAKTTILYWWGHETTIQAALRRWMVSSLSNGHVKGWRERYEFFPHWHNFRKGGPASRNLTLCTAASLAAALVTAMSSGAAYAAGPTHICYLSAGVSENGVAPNNSINALFALGSSYLFTGQYGQNGNISFNGNWTAWIGYSTHSDYILVGARRSFSEDSRGKRATAVASPEQRRRLPRKSSVGRCPAMLLSRAVVS